MLGKRLLKHHRFQVKRTTQTNAFWSFRCQRSQLWHAGSLKIKKNILTSEKRRWRFPKMLGFPPKSSIFNRVFQYKPSILGYPYFWKHPDDFWTWKCRSFLKVQLLNFLPIPGVYILKTLTRLEPLLYKSFLGWKKILMKPTTNHTIPSTKQRSLPQNDTSSGIHLAYGFFFGFHVTFQHAPLWRLVFHCREKSASMVGVRWTKFPRNFGDKKLGGGCRKKWATQFSEGENWTLSFAEGYCPFRIKKNMPVFGCQVATFFAGTKKNVTGVWCFKRVFSWESHDATSQMPPFFPGQ